VNLNLCGSPTLSFAIVCPLAAILARGFDASASMPVQVCQLLLATIAVRENIRELEKSNKELGETVLEVALT
jgi:hypothetical protein